MGRLQIGDIKFEMEQSLVEVTSLNRPDPGWRFTDKAGHLHRWAHVEGELAEAYSPSKSYIVPTIKKVSDGKWWCADCNDEHEDWHWECAQCGDVVVPGTTADSNRQYIPGLASYRVNGEGVTKEEFDRRLAEAQLKRG